MMPPKPIDIWQEFHWAFFLDTQGLILCMKRLGLMLDRHNINGARVELDAAAQIMTASGAAMALAGSFTRESYETQIRETMMPPHVASEGFSGLMSWEHGILVNIWRGLRPKFAGLPAELRPAHDRFVAAYKTMADGHVNVCSRFVGESAHSLRYDDRDAVQSLRRFGDARRRLIAPEDREKGAHP
ncbi:hypothetical protein [Roseobacter sp.]|uniref:hypothetical protein n=1 Tax=Roseobacter sp. TaxID=1907202 RepID=UPI0032976F6E